MLPRSPRAGRRLLLFGGGFALLAACGRSAFEGGADPGGSVTPTPTGSVTGTATPGPTPTPPFGTAQDGPLDVAAAVTVNVCRELTSASVAGATVELGTSTSAEFHPGRRVLFLQVQDVFATTNDPTPVAVAGSAGLWEMRRIAAVTTSGTARVLTLDSALGNVYASSGNRHAQACTVPEYSSVQIENGQTLGAAGWDGKQGGVVAFYVDGLLDLRSTGEISADDAGFRGGQPTSNSATFNVVDDDTSGGDGGGKGESLDGSAHAKAGRGNYGNGAGGGNSVNAGGGGGGNGGAGGLGGDQSDQIGSNPGTQGRGGAQVVFDPFVRLSFGGGGGAGQENNSSAGRGGRGGGLILIIARRVAGAGAIHADGEGNGAIDSTNDGAGGGGAGGTILLQTSSLDPAFSAAITARGGTGGTVNRNNTSTNFGPGGGGGGGRLVVPAIVPSGALHVDAGANGQNSNGVIRGAMSGTPGVVTVVN